MGYKTTQYQTSPVLVRNLNTDKIIGYFATSLIASIYIDYTEGYVPTADRIYRAVKKGTSITSKRFGFSVSIKRLSEEQQKELGIKPYIVFKGNSAMPKAPFRKWNFRW